MDDKTATRCKFSCTSIRKFKAWASADRAYLYEAEFSAVTSGSPENQAFFEATPSGTLRVAAYKSDVFEVGKEYFIDIVECPTLN